MARRRRYRVPRRRVTPKAVLFCLLTLAAMALGIIVKFYFRG